MKPVGSTCCRTATTKRLPVVHFTTSGKRETKHSAPFCPGSHSPRLFRHKMVYAVRKRFGGNDGFGKPKFGGMDIIAYELTAAAALLFGQTDEGVPVAIIRGLNYAASEEENILNIFQRYSRKRAKARQKAIRTHASTASTATLLARQRSSSWSRPGAWRASTRRSPSSGSSSAS